VGAVDLVWTPCLGAKAFVDTVLTRRNRQQRPEMETPPSHWLDGV